MRKILVLIVAFLLAGVSFWYALVMRTVEEVPQTSVIPTNTLPIASSTNGEPLVITDTGYGDDVYEYTEDSLSDYFIRTETADTWTKLAEEGKELSLTKALTKMNVKVEPQILALLDTNVWSLYSCSDTSESGIRDTVLSMRFALQKNYQGNLYRDQSRYLAAWEATFMRDTLPLLFPKEYYSAVPSQKGYFSTDTTSPAVTLRTTEVEFPDSTIKKVGYIFVGDELLVGSDIVCLKRAQEQLFDTGA